ncbi:hypothetical protein ES703_70450 [subsurface metagenome]
MYETWEEVIVAFSVTLLLSRDMVTEAAFMPEPTSDRSALINGMLFRVVEFGCGWRLPMCGGVSSVVNATYTAVVAWLLL